MIDANGQLVRVFPRRTKATPSDELAFIGEPPVLTGRLANVGRIAVSVTFTWDIPLARYLEAVWRHHYAEAEVSIGGPAFGDPGGEFEPAGRFVGPVVARTNTTAARCELT